MRTHKIAHERVASSPNQKGFRYGSLGNSWETSLEDNSFEDIPGEILGRSLGGSLGGSPGGSPWRIPGGDPWGISAGIPGGIPEVILGGIPGKGSLRGLPTCTVAVDVQGTLNKIRLHMRTTLPWESTTPRGCGGWGTRVQGMREACRGSRDGGGIPERNPWGIYIYIYSLEGILWGYLLRCGQYGPRHTLEGVREENELNAHVQSYYGGGTLQHVLPATIGRVPYDASSPHHRFHQLARADAQLTPLSCTLQSTCQ